MPADLPGSYEFQQYGKLNYIVTGYAKTKYRYVKYKYNSIPEVMFKEKNATVLNRTSSVVFNNKSKPLTNGEFNKIFMGGNGNVYMEASIKSCLVSSGSNIPIGLFVNNQTKKRIQGLKISFVKTLVFTSTEDSKTTEIKETVVNTVYKDKDFSYDSEEQRYSMIYACVPVQYN